MKFHYDPEVDAMSCFWGEDGQVAESDEIEGGVILDYDANGRVIGVEILDAKKRLEILGPDFEAELLQQGAPAAAL